MTSLFTAGEEALARLGLAATPGDDLDVLIGGLGLGYTAHAALRDSRVSTVHVVETLAEVIRWHHEHLVPLGAELTGDPRCRLVHGDFFSMISDGAQLDTGISRFDAVLVDIDHTPSHHLAGGHSDFYRADGLTRVRDHLRPGGVFALWSDDPPDAGFVDVLRTVFPDASAEVVAFPNHYTDSESSITVYVGPTPPARGGRHRAAVVRRSPRLAHTEAVTRDAVIDVRTWTDTLTSRESEAEDVGDSQHENALASCRPVAAAGLSTIALFEAGA